jgi:protein SCO1
MNFLRLMRYALWGIILLISLGVGLSVLGLLPQRDGQSVQSTSVPFATPFTLTSHDNTPFSSESLKGAPYALFFGFTNCPDVCPTTLFDMSERLKALGPEGAKLKVLFISVDPERDTPEFLKRYLSSFDPRIIGLTGSPEAIKAVAKNYRAYFEKVPTNDGKDYTMNHTALVFLLDSKGQFVGTIDYKEAPEVAHKKLVNLLKR